MSDQIYPPPPPPPIEGKLEEATSLGKRAGDELEPERKRRPDGSLERVSPAVLAAAGNIQEWIAARRKNWPTAERTQARQNTTEAAADAQPDQAARPVKICRYFARGKCRSGDACRFAHTDPREPRKQQPTIYKRFEPPVRNSLFVKLMQTDHDGEDVRILSFIAELDAAGKLDK